MKFLKKNKDVIWFSLLKYLEILITAFTTFFVAKKLGPKEMGYAIPVLLYITYANYLALGVNQVVTKNLSRYNDELKIRNMITINLQFIIIVSVVNILLAFLILDLRASLLAAIISIGVILRGFFASYYRAVYRIRVLNKNNLIFSVFLFLFVFFFVESLQDYLLFWAVCVTGALVLFFLDDVKFFVGVFKNMLTMHPKSELIFNLSEGSKLALTGLVTTVLLTSDRLVINQMSIPVEMKGSYQLADYAGTALYMFCTTIVFYFYPKWIENLRINSIFRMNFIRLMKIGLFGIPVCLVVVFFLSKIVAYLIFPEFLELDNFITLSVFIKLAVIYLSLLSLYHIGIDREIAYLKSLVFLFSSLIISLSFVYYLKWDYFWIPIVIGTLIFMEVIRKLFFLTITSKELNFTDSVK